MMNSELRAPIVVFCFNRLDTLILLFDSLINCSEAIDTEVFIYVDGPRNNLDKNIQSEIVNVLCKYEKYFLNFSLILREKNLGLRTSLIRGVSDILIKYECVIVIEDDLILSNNFIDYMNESLSFYKNNTEISGISAYSNFIEHKTTSTNYFHIRPCSWGWATWRDRWVKIDWDYKPKSLFEYIKLWFLCKPVGDDIFRMFRYHLTHKINSWAISWTIHSINNNLKTSYPFDTKVQNVGFGDEATHCKNDNPFVSKFIAIQEKNYKLLNSVVLNRNIITKYNSYFSNFNKLYFKIKKFFSH
ncbi:glycosyltransferase family A protein [Shewanella frigidimarina]|uniref:glycosyltransferase family A protein n=1 Tax=Shewanella frigidimarina TaxID=56812 RepID=UPI003D7BA55E